MSDLVRDNECCALVIRASLEQSPREVDVLTGRGERSDDLRPWHYDDESLSLGHDALQA